jgi:outer membrane protein OmpA-like peptidoglycan-associated protein
MTWLRIKSGMRIVLPFGLIILFIAGCAPSHKEVMAREQMERAKKAYAEAKANPNVEAYAPVELQEAGKALHEAENAEKAQETDDMLQLGYLAERKTQFAVTTTEGKVAERDIDKLNVEKSRMIAMKQTLEAERARGEMERSKMEAGKATLEAERSKMEAGKATLEAERSKMEAGKATLEAENARREAERARIETERLKMEAGKALTEAEQARAAAAVEAAQAAQAKLEAEQARLAAQAEAEKAAQAKADADQLMKELSELKAQQTERGIVLTIGDVLFATGKANLSPAADKSVAKLAEFLKKYPTRNVLIEGHTDSVGSDDFNLALSQQRANSVKARLVADAVDAARITTVGYGEKYPVASNDTKAGKAQNRRVDLIVLNEGVKAETQMRR